MGGRALGSNTTLAGAFEAAYGTPPGGNWLQMPFVSSQLGEERPLIMSDLLGQGREGQDPTPDVATNDGDIVVPVDLRYFWIWLRLMMGDPVTSLQGNATGTVTFSDMPAVGSTVTLSGVVFTFVSAAAVGNQVQITSGMSLNSLVGALTNALNASAVAAIAAATYSNTGHVMTITFDVAGPANGYTLAASGTSNAVVSGQHLAWSANALHVFKSGAASLPSMAYEIAHPEIPNYEVHFGGLGNQMKIGLTRSGLLSAAVSLIAQGEADPNPVSSAGTATSMTIDRFAQATGSITQDGAVLGEVVAADFTFSNNLDKVEVISDDGRIAGADPGMVGMTGSLTIKYTDTTLQTKASNGTPVKLTFGWKLGAWSLTFTINRVFLPKVKRPVAGPKGIQAQYNWQASGATGTTCTASLNNDVTNYSAKLALPVETFAATVPADGDGSNQTGDGGTGDGDGGDGDGDGAGAGA